MEVCHVESAVFDDPNLVSCAGLGPVVALAEQCGLPQLVAAQLTLPAKAGVNAHLKVPALVGAMVAGADSIADTDLLRHGGMDRLFGEVRAPSTLGTFLRAFTFGHVRQLDAVAGQLRADSALYGHDVVAAARRAGARFSITARSSPAGSTAIASIRADAWTPIHYPNAVWDEAEQRLISDAEIAEVPFTAFTSRRTAEHISGRLMVRREVNAVN